MKLTKEQAGWVDALQKENPDLPVGYARAMVEWYIQEPERFTPEQIEEWQRTPVPTYEKTPGTIETYTGEEAEKLFAKMKADCATCEVLPVEENSQDKLDGVPSESVC